MNQLPLKYIQQRIVTFPCRPSSTVIGITALEVDCPSGYMNLGKLLCASLSSSEKKVTHKVTYLKRWL